MLIRFERLEANAEIYCTVQTIEVFISKKCFSSGQRFLVQFGLQNAMQKVLKSYQVPFLSNG